MSHSNTKDQKIKVKIRIPGLNNQTTTPNEVNSKIYEVREI